MLNLVLKIGHYIITNALHVFRGSLAIFYIDIEPLQSPHVTLADVSAIGRSH